MDRAKRMRGLAAGGRRTGERSSAAFHQIARIAMLLAGAFGVAAAFNLFLLPSGIASGGVSGISVLAQRLTGIEPAYVQWALNVPLFLAGWRALGRRFALRSALGTLTLPLFVLLTAGWHAPTANPLLAAIFGGMGVGLGLGLVFRGQGSTGGLDTAAQILHKYTGLRIGLALACIDGTVIAAAGLILSPESALYALIALFVTSKTIDVVQTGFKASKVAFIISSREEAIARSVLQDIDRGLTKLDARGGYTDTHRAVLMVVVGQHEVTKLKSAVKAADPAAFVIISDTAEVLGEGFQQHGI